MLSRKERLINLLQKYFGNLDLEKVKRKIMRLHFIKSALILCPVISVGLTSCLKDKDYDKGLIQSVHATGAVPKVVEIKLTAANTSNFLTASYDNSNNDTVVDLIPVNLATADAASQDIHVTLTANPALVTQYNANNGTDYADPSSMYTVQNDGVVTIPKGSHTGYLQIKFKPSEFLGANWAVSFVISDIAESGYTISGNLNTGIVAIGIKNAYEGNYNTSGERTRYNGATEASGVLDMFTISGVNYFATLNSNTIAGQLADAGSGGTVALTINADNTVTVSNPPGGAYPDLTNTSGKTSTYDPATQTMHFYASYHNASGNLRTVDETMVKQ